MVVEIDGANPDATRFWVALGKPCNAWRHSDAIIETTVGQLDEIPEGFIKGEVWKRFWKEEPYTGTGETEVLQAQE